MKTSSYLIIGFAALVGILALPKPWNGIAFVVLIVTFLGVWIAGMTPEKWKNWLEGGPW